MKPRLLLSILVLCGLDAGAQHVGIGTVSPVARLHVADSSVLFSASGDVPASPGAVPSLSLPARRLLWYADKAALRAEYLTGTPGFLVNEIGAYSLAVGIDNEASANNAVAMGTQNRVRGSNSFALGSGHNVTGVRSLAMGSTNEVSGSYAMAGGTGSSVTGSRSQVFGLNSRVTGNSSFAFGSNLLARCDGCVSLGMFNDSSDAYIPFTYPLTDRIFQLGNGISGILSNALTILRNGRAGFGVLSPLARLHVADSSVLFSAPGSLPVTPSDPPVSGAGRRMMWYPDMAAFRAGYVSGSNWDKDSIGLYSISAGNNTKARGFAAVSLGNLSEANGSGSFATGNARSLGDYSFTGGYLNNAYAGGSSAFGLSNYANGFSSFVVGQFSDSVVARQGNTGADQTPGTPLFIVGNGTGPASRKNALVVCVNGNTGVSTSQPGAKVDVNGDLALRQSILSLTNGNNHNVAAGNFSFVNVDNPTAAFTITGVQGGVDGKILTILNTSTQNMTIANLNAGSDPPNRINTLSGTDITTTGNGSVTLQYSTAHSRWMVIALRD